MVSIANIGPQIDDLCTQIVGMQEHGLSDGGDGEGGRSGLLDELDTLLRLPMFPSATVDHLSEQTREYLRAYVKGIPELRELFRELEAASSC